MVSLAWAQEDPNARIDRLEQHLREMVGQIEELNHQVQVLQKQVAATNTRKSGALETPAAGADEANPAGNRNKAMALSQKSAPVETALSVASSGGAGIEEIQSEPLAVTGTEQSGVDNKAYATILGGETISTGENTQLDPALAQKGVKPLGSPESATVKPDDGGFPGKVLVPAGGGVEIPGQNPGDATAAGVETASLNPDTPEVLYESSNENLLRRKFDLAAAGFQQFVDKYPTHSLAGNAQYWLGETYYAQGDYKQAAQNYLKAYKQYPKGRRAPDSLVKLGVSLNKLGQQEQACASFATVSSEYPNAVEAKKRAQAEMKRDGC